MAWQIMEGGHKAVHFLLIWKQQDAALLKQTCWLPVTMVELRKKSRQRATIFLVSHMDSNDHPEVLPRPLDVGKSRIWKFPRGLRKEEGDIGKSFPSLISFLSWWLICERKSPGGEASSRETDMWHHAVTWAYQQPCLKSL